MTRSRIVAAAASAVLALSLGLSAAAPAPAMAARVSCGTFVGPAWTFFDPMKEPHNQQGTKWRVITQGGVPCSYARAIAKQLVKTPFKGEAGTRLKSPKGWSCFPGGGSGNTGGKGTPGSCSKGSKGFGWGPATQ